MLMKLSLLIALTLPSISFALPKPKSVYLIKKSPLLEIYWSTKDCRPACGFSHSKVKALELAPLIESEMTRNLSVFDAWAANNLSFWAQRRNEVFPVRFIINPDPQYQGAGVRIQPFKYLDERGKTQKASRRPIIDTGIFEKDKWNVYSQMLIHEFGHNLTYALGAPGIFGPYLEAFADMLAMTFEPRGWRFMPETAEDFRKSPNRPEILRISSLKGERDFTLSTNPRFLEANGVDGIYDSYFTSSLVNSTFYQLAPHVNVGRFVEAFLELLNAELNVAMDGDLMETMSRMLQIYQQKHPQEFALNSTHIKQALSDWGWAAAANVSEFVTFKKVALEKGKVILHISFPRPVLFPPSDFKATVLAMVYGNGRPLKEMPLSAKHTIKLEELSQDVKEFLETLTPEKRKQFEESWRASNDHPTETTMDLLRSCEEGSATCFCFKEKVKLSARFFYPGSDGVMRRSALSEARTELEPGCYDPH